MINASCSDFFIPQILAASSKSEPMYLLSLRKAEFFLITLPILYVITCASALFVWCDLWKEI